jgi:hypothetical protein
MIIGSAPMLLHTFPPDRVLNVLELSGVFEVLKGDFRFYTNYSSGYLSYRTTPRLKLKERNCHDNPQKR